MPKSTPASLQNLHAGLRHVSQVAVERVAASRMKNVLCRLLRKVLDLQFACPVAALLRRLPHHVELRAQPFNHRCYLRQRMSLAYQRGAQLAHCLQRLHVVAADLAAHVALPAQRAFEDRILDPFGHRGAAVHQRERRHQPTARGVGVELAGLDTRTSPRELRALHQIERNPFAIGAPCASHGVCTILFQCHLNFS